MSKEFSRSQRVGELIQRELAHIIRREVNRTDLGIITISEVKVSPDLGYARVYVTILGGDPEATSAIQYLNHTAGSLRHYLSQRLTLRVTPRLQFVHDSSLEYGNRLTALINSVIPPATSSQK